jgi:UDP-N-acetylmuramoylalanine--D-glutamate ligase
MPMINDKKLGIFGLGLTGKATYQFLKGLKYSVVCYDDSSNCRNEFIKIHGSGGVKDLSDAAWQDLSRIIISPGVSPNHEIFHLANKYNIEIISDIELLYEHNNNSFFIGITGTNGKSTTTALVSHILKSIGLDYPERGNIGVPALSASSKDGYLLELSSFQIDLFKNIKLNIAALLNITPDHLDRYGNMENYVNSKLVIFSNMAYDDFAVIGADNQITNRIIRQNKIKPQIITFSAKEKQKGGVAVVNNKIYDDIWEPITIAIADNKALQGGHNMENIAASYAICRLLKIEPLKIVLGINSFTGLPHRMQYLGKVNKVNFYNDSKATNIDSASKSIGALDNIYWIAGGIAKEENLDGISSYFCKIKKAYLYGRDRAIFANSLKDVVEFEIVNTLEEAFKAAHHDAERDNGASDKNILLAPAAASTDQFKNFEERGNKFIELYEMAKTSTIS